MPAVLDIEGRGSQADAHWAESGRVSALHGQLRALGRDARVADTVVAACLVWVADALLEIAVTSADPRSTSMLLDEASAALAAVPHNGDGGNASGNDTGHPDPVVSARLLTEREHVVLVRLQDDVPLRQIGLELFVSRNTVKSHVHAVYRKLGVSSRTEAVDRARRLRLL